MSDETGTQNVDRTTMVAELVSAYVSNNRVPPAELPSLILTVHAALTELTDGTAGGTEPAVEKPTPAQIRKSITHDTLISFEDGKPYKTLKRHLSLHGLSPEGYRAKWGLGHDYPMVAASYSEARSALAKSLGLGQLRKGAASEPAPAAEAEAPKKPSGRKAKEAAE